MQLLCDFFRIKNLLVESKIWGWGAWLAHLLEVSNTELVRRLQEIIPVAQPVKTTQALPQKDFLGKASSSCFPQSCLPTAAQVLVTRQAKAQVSWPCQWAPI